MPLSPYKGNPNATSPSESGVPYLVTLDGPIPGAAPTTITHADSPYDVLDSDQTLLVDTSGGVVTIVLPADPDNGRYLYVKRTTTDGNTLTIDGNGNDIDGSASDFVDANAGLSNYTFQFDDPSGWWTI